MKKSDIMFWQVVSSIVGIVIATIVGFYVVLPVALGDNVPPTYAYSGAVLTFAIILGFWIKKLVVKIGK